MNIQERVRAHLDRVAVERSAARTAAARLQPLAIMDWPAVIRTTPMLRSAGSLSYVLDIAQEKLEQDASEAVLLAELVLECLASDPENIVLRGRAMKVHAHGLRQTGQGHVAHLVIQESMAILSAAFPAGCTQFQYSKLLLAYLSHERGDTYLALRYLRETIGAFQELGHASGLLQSRMMQAAILFEEAQYERARHLFLHALKTAEDLGDERSCARILANLGQCSRSLGHDEEAIAYFAEAVPLFENLRMDEGIHKIIWGMAAIARRRGQLTQALTALRTSRDAFLQRGMFLTAAVIGLDMLNLVIMSSRYDLAQPLAADLISVFEASDIPKAAFKELTDLALLASYQALDSVAINTARTRVRMFLAA